jgi:hypothetical protein
MSYVYMGISDCLFEKVKLPPGFSLLLRVLLQVRTGGPVGLSVTEGMCHKTELVRSPGCLQYMGGMSQGPTRGPMTLLV